MPHHTWLSRKNQVCPPYRAMNTPVVYRGSCPRCGGAAMYRAEPGRLVGACEVAGCWWASLVEFRSVKERQTCSRIEDGKPLTSTTERMCLRLAEQVLSPAEDETTPLT